MPQQRQIWSLRGCALPNHKELEILPNYKEKVPKYEQKENTRKRKYQTAKKVKKKSYQRGAE